VTERNVSLLYTGELENDLCGALLPDEEGQERLFSFDKIPFLTTFA
jgi:hypothetical protein